jgi:hypothetical protein
MDGYAHAEWGRESIVDLLMGKASSRQSVLFSLLQELE